MQNHLDIYFGKHLLNPFFKNYTERGLAVFYNLNSADGDQLGVGSKIFIIHHHKNVALK